MGLDIRVAFDNGVIVGLDNGAIFVFGQRCCNPLDDCGDGDNMTIR